MSNITFPLTFTTLLPYEIYNHQNTNWNVNEYYLIVMELYNINDGKYGICTLCNTLKHKKHFEFYLMMVGNIT